MDRSPPGNPLLLLCALRQLTSLVVHAWCPLVRPAAVAAVPLSAPADAPDHVPDGGGAPSGDPTADPLGSGSEEEAEGDEGGEEGGAGGAAAALRTALLRGGGAGGRGRGGIGGTEELLGALGVLCCGLSDRVRREDSLFRFCSRDGTAASCRQQQAQAATWRCCRRLLFGRWWRRGCGAWARWSSCR